MSITAIISTFNGSSVLLYKDGVSGKEVLEAIYDKHDKWSVLYRSFVYSVSFENGKTLFIYLK